MKKRPVSKRLVLNTETLRMIAGGPTLGSIVITHCLEDTCGSYCACTPAHGCKPPGA